MLRIKAPAGKGGLGSLRNFALTTAAAVPILYAATAGFGILSAPKEHRDPEVTGSISPAPLAIEGSLLDPRPMLGKSATPGWSGVPLSGNTLRMPALATARTVAPPPAAEPLARPAPPLPTPAPEAARSSRATQIVPLPVPRPAELAAQAGAPAVSRTTTRPAQRRTRAAAAVPTAQADDRSWFEKLFDLNTKGAAPGVSYTALDSRPTEVVPRPRLTPSPIPAPATQAGTAVYNIMARTVTLPSGERLEAHSGLRDKIDDPRFAHVRMQGVTPPGTYDLTEREALFHGVRAIRLNPVGGSGAVHGRAGLLAHTYLLGPNGDSNGCVSFKDYDRFLQAYLRGEIRRLVVVAGNGQDRLPSFANSEPGPRQGWSKRPRGA